MAMATFTLDGNWQQVFDGSVNNVILQVSEACELAIATTTPVGADLDKAIKLRDKDSGSGYEFTSSGMAGQKIYLRENSGFSKSIATVASW